MIPFYLITGFLGSGKTTFLSHILSDHPEGEKIAVIQNEFAPNGIDGKLLTQASPDIQLTEINNGSVFCACLMDNFIEVLQHIVEKYHPDRIFLEASGLADPGTLNQVMTDARLKEELISGGTICLVDALNFDQALHRLPRVVQQTRIADLILINKSDCVDSLSLTKVEQHIRQLNPIAESLTTTYARLNQRFWDRHHQEPGSGKNKLLILPGGGRPDLKSAVLKSARLFPADHLENFLTELSTLAIRAKGFINLTTGQTLLFQSVFGQYSYEEYPNYPENIEMTAIGENLDAHRLREVFSKYLI